MHLRALALMLPLVTWGPRAPLSQNGPKTHVIQQQDAYSGLREWHLRVGTHHCTTAPATNEWGAHLDFSAFEEPDQTITYAVAPELDMRTAFKPHGRAVLETLADGKPAQFPQSSDVVIQHFRTRLGRSVSEVIPFALQRYDLEVMSHVSTLQFRLDTRNGQVERCAKASDLRDLAALLQATAKT
jgi:hypothetical protein